MKALKILSNACPAFLNAVAVAVVFLAATPAVSQEGVECEVVSVGDIQFGCVITGSDADGFSVWAHWARTPETNRKCKVTITVTKSDGSKQSWTYRDRIVYAIAKWGGVMGGEASVSGEPLSNPKLSDASCDSQ
jgi:hypothetical protein